MTEILIALAEDNAVNRNTFLNKIRSFPALQMVFVANNGHECLQHLKGLPASKHPAVIFMDLEMPEMDGIQTIGIAKSLYSHIHFIVLTVFDDDEKIFEAIKAGASGYLLKDDTSEEINNAVSLVLTYGGAPMSPAIARKALNLLGRAQVLFTGNKNDANELNSLLSQRESDILKQVISGLDAKRIAEILEISVLTVRKHVSNIYQKLHVNSKAQVMRLAIDRGWFNA